MMALPQPVQTTHPALLGPVSALAPSSMPMASSCQVPKCTGVPGPGYPPGWEGLDIFKAVKFCILAQSPAPRASGQLRLVWPAQPWTYICPESGRPFTAARYKVQTRLSLRCLKIGKNRLAACGVRAHHASVLVTPGGGLARRQSARLKTYCCA